MIFFPSDSDSKESACSVRDPVSIPRLERCPGEGNGYPLQYSCLENSMPRGTWLATAHGVTKSWTQLSNFTHLAPLITKAFPDHYAKPHSPTNNHYPCGHLLSHPSAPGDMLGTIRTGFPCHEGFPGTFSLQRFLFLII